jgi:hypothetical protein
LYPDSAQNSIKTPIAAHSCPFKIDEKYDALMFQLPPRRVDQSKSSVLDLFSIEGALRDTPRIHREAATGTVKIFNSGDVRARARNIFFAGV